MMIGSSEMASELGISTNQLAALVRNGDVDAGQIVAGRRVWDEDEVSDLADQIESLEGQEDAEEQMVSDLEDADDDE